MRLIQTKFARGFPKKTGLNEVELIFPKQAVAPARPAAGY